ncbi:MAG: VUT family protein [Gammaproteobacteria bacterium]|nr:VUT family protein [Gammaproteobacteria bacterium]
MKKENFGQNVLLILASLYTIFMLLAYLNSEKELVFFFHIISNPGMIALPFALITMDIIAEIYGYYMARKILWISLIAQCVFCLAISFLAYLPDPNEFNSATTWDSYKQVFGIMPRVYFAYLIGMYIGTSLNSKLISKWKVLLKGKSFWLRSIAASAIGDGIFLGITTLLNGLYQYPLPQLLKFAAANYLVEIILLIILAPIANIIANYIKYKNGDSLAPIVEFNPFKK